MKTSIRTKKENKANRSCSGRRCTAILLFFFSFLSICGGGQYATCFVAKLSRHYIGERKESFEEILGLMRAEPETEGTTLRVFSTLDPVRSIPNLSYGEDKDKKAPEPGGVTVAELLALAEMNNPTLRMAKQNVMAAKGEWIQAGRKPNPVLAFEAEEVGSGGKAGKHGLVLEQEITTGGKRKWDRTVAAFGYDESRCRGEFRYYAIRNDVKVAIYEVLAARRSVETRARLAEIAEKSVEAAVELSKAGEVSKIDLLQIRAKSNEAVAALGAAKTEEQVIWRKLACLIGIQDLEPMPIAESLDMIETDQDRDSAWFVFQEGTPQLKIAKTKVRQARAALGRQEAETKSDVTVSGGIHYDYGDRQTLASFGVGVPLRIYDKNQGNIMKARAELAMACRDLDRQKLVLYEEFSSTYAVLENSREQARIYSSQILPDVYESLTLSLKGYRQGEYSYMDVLSAQQTFLETQTQYTEILKNHASASVYLDGFLAKGALEGLSE